MFASPGSCIPGFAPPRLGHAFSLDMHFHSSVKIWYSQGSDHGRTVHTFNLFLELAEINIMSLKSNF